MEQLKPPSELSLDGNLAENWRKWIQSLELFFIASGISEKDEKVQCAAFLHVAGEDARAVYNTFEFNDEDDREDLDILKGKFKEYCEPRKNLTYLRHQFFMRTQEPGETFDAFATDIRNKAKNCEFGELCDSLVRDRIVCGIKDDSLRARLLREADLPLHKAIDQCRASEASQKQLRQFSAEDEHAERQVHDLKKPARFKQKPEYSDKKRNSKPVKTMKCGNCGGEHSNDKQTCPAIGKTCNHCRKRNHFAKVCRSKKATPSRSTVHEVQWNQTSPDPDELFIGEIHSASHDGHELFSDLTVNGKNIRFKLDTGAQCNVLSKDTYTELGSPTLVETNTKLTAYGGHRVPVKGKCRLKIEHYSKVYDAEFYVVEIPNARALIGLKTCRDLKLITVNHVHTVKDTTQDLLEEYSDVFTGLGLVSGEYHIELRNDATPTIHPSRKVPLSLMPKLKETLEQLTESGVISKVDRPTDWVSSLVLVEKKDGSLRLCLDPKDLNRAIKREHYTAPTAEAISSTLSGMKVFTVIDMSNCYWHKKLDEESSLLCTFNTPYGRHKFNRMPFGICSAAEVAQKMVDNNFSDIPGVLAVHDDIIVAGTNTEEHDRSLRLTLERARQRNIKFNKKKIQLRVPEVKYLGSIVSDKGFRPDPDKIKAILDMPQPQNKQDLQRLLGMVNYLSQYIPNMSELTSPLRALLKNDSQWTWYAEQQNALDKVKKALTSSPVLRFFDVKKDITLQVDASQSGIGACLLQENHPVIYASRSLTTTEQHYAQIEKELLAIVYACERFNQFVYGKEILVQSDHKPLEAIMVKPLSKAPPRVQRLLIRLQKYQPTVRYVPGKYLFIADTLSRAYLQEDERQEELSDDIEVMVHTFVTSIPATPEKLDELQKETAADTTLQALKKQIAKGWPDHKHVVPPLIAPYWNVRHELNEAEGLLFKEDKLIIPSTMRKHMLGLIHESHLGIEKCKSRAREIIYWPGMSNDIQEKVSKCPTCAEHKSRNQKEPMLPHEIPERPWQKVASDLLEHKGKNYLVIVDYYSKFIETSLLKDKKAGTVVTHMKSIFARHGIPEELISDNMPYDSREFKEFTRNWGIKQTTSSPTYAQSNGLSEKAVQTVKSILKKAEDPYIGLLEYRNTPITGMAYSPSQLLMSRVARTKIPTTKEILQPRIATNVLQQLEHCQQQQKHHYDKGSRTLKPLQQNEGIRILKGKTWEPAVVSGMAHTPRSYIVTTPNGQQYRRNRRHLQKTGEQAPTTTGPDQDDYTAPDQPPTRTDNLPTLTQPQNGTDQNPPRRSTRPKTVPAKFNDYVVG